MTPRGEYSDKENYDVLDFVTYNGSSFVAKQPTTGHAPTLSLNDNYWQLLASGGGIFYVEIP